MFTNQPAWTVVFIVVAVGVIALVSRMLAAYATGR